MPLSLRLKTIAALVPKGARVCDVGTDHARLPIYLISEKIASRVIATDLRPLPLENAKKNLDSSGVTGIELRLCDGLSAVKKDEADVIIIAGIGGEVISGIIARADLLKEQPSPPLILQPTTSPEALRRYLCENGFIIETETAIQDNGKLYSVISARFSGIKYQKPDSYYYVGKVDPKTPDGFLYIKKQYTRIKDCAVALKNLPEKREEYIYYKNLADNIGELIKEKR